MEPRGSMVERKERSPPRQKASVVPKSTLICDLADPSLEEACFLFTFAIEGSQLVVV